jgi:hypothetical protein
VVVVGVVGVVVAAVVVVYIYPLFSGPAAPYLLLWPYSVKEHYAEGFVYTACTHGTSGQFDSNCTNQANPCYGPYHMVCHTRVPYGSMVATCFLGSQWYQGMA